MKTEYAFIIGFCVAAAALIIMASGVYAILETVIILAKYIGI